MDFKNTEAKELMLKYAAPCSDNPKEFSRNLLNGELDLDPKEDFPMAYNMLNVTAEKENKSSIDKETVRKYFWEGHGELLKENNPDKDMEEIEECLVLPGKLIKENGDFKASLINGEKREVNAMLIDNPEQGIDVSIHKDWAVEKIDEKDRERLKKAWRDLKR